MPAFAVQGGSLIQLHHGAIDPGAHEALGLEFLKHALVLALAVIDDRRKQHHPSAFGQGQNLVHHLAHGLGVERNPVVRAAWRAGASIQKAQVVVDLGNRADRGPWVVRRGFLLDGNGR